jgi:hypothetical protein
MAAGYFESFQALQNALEALTVKEEAKPSQKRQFVGLGSVDLSATSSSSSSDLSLEIYETYSRKRKNVEHSPNIRYKKLGGEVGNDLSTRFASQITLEKPLVRLDLDLSMIDTEFESSAFAPVNQIPKTNSSDLTPFITARIQQLGKANNVSFNVMLDEWQSKKRALIQHLSFLQRPQDSYDDVKLFYNQVVDMTLWLCDNNFNELRVVAFPLTIGLRPSLEICRTFYIKCIEVYSNRRGFPSLEINSRI